MTLKTCFIFPIIFQYSFVLLAFKTVFEKHVLFSYIHYFIYIFIFMYLLR